MHVANPANWVKLYGDLLFSVALQKTNSKELAEDLVQDTFLSAVKALPNYRGEASEKNWLFTILNNKIIDHYRKKGRNAESIEDYLSETEESFNNEVYSNNNGVYHISGDSWKTNWSSQADNVVNSKEFEAVLLNCINKIPLKMKPIFMDKYFEDLPTDEVCKLHNITAANYWVIVHRVKVILKNCLTLNWFKHT